jgi:alkylation response protein AidB-like acyl-CoA dehydrogenase
MTPTPSLTAWGYELQPRTPAGKRLLAIAEELGPAFTETSAEYDRSGAFPYEYLEAMKDSGYLYAAAPEEAGGMGVESHHDLWVASSRVARADASITLGSNMHIITLAAYVRGYRRLAMAGKTEAAEAAVQHIAGLVSGRTAIAAAQSEPSQRLTSQQTKAVATPAGWVINGHKIFSSMAPAATHFTVAVNFTNEQGEERFMYLLVERDAPGITVNDDWDALGMRSSGSVSVTFRDCLVKGPTNQRGIPAGKITAEYLELLLSSGAAHTAASVGVVEAAHQYVVDGAWSRMRSRGEEAVRSTARHLAAENAIEISAMRASFERALDLMDGYFAEHATTRGSLDEANNVFGEVQRAKTFSNQVAKRAVDRALSITGGAAFASGHPLSRLYRDARAGSFMHPLGENIAYEYLGSLALGLRPLDL